MGCEFNLRSSLIALQRDFRQGVDEGINQTGRLITDIKTRIQEKLQPETAYFLTQIEVRINPLTAREDLYWQGYKRSIDESIRRHIALLRVRDESEARINQATAERRTWQMIRDRGLGLIEGEGIQFMALRTTNPAEGVAVQQLSRRDGQIILESQLLPFDKIDQIDNFRDLLGQRGKDISLESVASDIDPVITWAVQGPAFDFQQDLPGMIEQINRPLVFPDDLPAMIPMVNPDLLRQLPEVRLAEPVLTLIDRPLKSERQVQASSMTSFWFETAAEAEAEAVSSIVEAPRILLMTNEITPDEIPLRLDFVDILHFLTPAKISTPVVDLEKDKPVTVTVFEAPVVQPLVINSEQKQKFKPLATIKKDLNVTAAKTRCCFPEKRILEKPETATVVFESAAQQKKLIYEIQAARGEGGKAETKTKVKVEEKEQIKTAETEVVKKAVPIYQSSWRPMAIEDIPEWVWQGTAANPDELLDWTWFLVTMFYALLNTKALLKIETS